MLVSCQNWITILVLQCIKKSGFCCRFTCPLKVAGAYEYNYNNGLFLTLFLYFSYGAEASNLKCTIVLLVTYCVQNMKRQKLVLVLGALRFKKPSFVASHFHALCCITLPLAGEPYFTTGFSPTHWLAVL